MLEVEILILKTPHPVYGCTARSISVEEIATLYHEVFDLSKIQISHCYQQKSVQVPRSSCE